MNAETRPFRWLVRVYYEDTDAQGVVYYANYFRFMERARTEWIRALGIEQDRLLESGRRFFVVVETAAEFHSPARFNDELVVTVDLVNRSRASFVLDQQIFLKDDESRALVSATVRAACVNADTKKPARLPELLSKELPI